MHGLPPGKGTQRVSTSAQISPAWKQEVNRRLAEHRGRKGSSPAEPKPATEIQHNASRRAVEAAARVAARYAHAPSYSKMMADEALVGLHTAATASPSVVQAAELEFAGVEAASGPRPLPEPASGPALALLPEPLAEPLREPDLASRLASAVIAAQTFDESFDWAVESHREPEHGPGPELVRDKASAVPEPAAVAAMEELPVSVRWDESLPALPVEPVEARAARGQDPFATGAEDWWRPAAIEPERADPEQIEVVEPVQPIPANLIEFPRELVATRKARPRLAEAPQAASGVQLSIFEVDPVSLSSELASEVSADPGQFWSSSAWAEMKLEAHPLEATRLEPHPQASPAPVELEEPAPVPQAVPALAPAPASQRLLAMVVDGALIAGSLLAAAVMAASRARVLPGPRTLEIGMGVALLVTAALYQVLFFTLGHATPGMKYARVRLATWEGQTPARAQRCRRLGALLVSALPVGLGLAWSLFDDDHLTWHDRLSRTYVCKRP